MSGRLAEFDKRIDPLSNVDGMLAKVGVISISDLAELVFSLLQLILRFNVDRAKLNWAVAVKILNTGHKMSDRQQS